MPPPTAKPPKPQGTPAEVFAVSLRLGCTSFGGPIAHIGYFQRAYVRQRQWITADEFAGLVALCQLIPGPASSQLGYLIGLKRAGWPGALAAWVGFTLPSALLMFGFAVVAPRLSGPLAAACLHGLKLVAVVIVAQAIWSMARSLCPDRLRAGVALLATTALLVPGWQAMQLPVRAAGAILGGMLCQNAAKSASPALPVSRKMGGIALGLFAGLMVLALWPISAGNHTLPALMAVFYRSGALVFGGGHVVLPLLRGGLVPTGWLGDGPFLAGYGAAQAMPGPLFTLAAYLGASLAPAHAGSGTIALWSAAALTAIFLPGLLIAVAGLSVWGWLGQHPRARGCLAGANAAVVGVLGAAFVTPVWTSAIASLADIAIAATGLMMLMRFRVAPILIVGFCVAAAAVLH